MRKCIDCGVELTKETQSFHQPQIRCLKCYEIFAGGVKETLEKMIKDMEPFNIEQTDVRRSDLTGL